MKTQGSRIAFMLFTAIALIPATASCGMPISPAEALAQKEHNKQIQELINACAEPALDQQIADEDGSWMQDRVKSWRVQENSNLMPSVATQDVFANFLIRTSLKGLPGIKVNRERCAAATVRSPAVHSDVMFTDDEVEDLAPR